MREILELGLKNILRQKIRTLLTIIGIMIGIAAIVALGSISEGLSKEVSEALEQASGQIFVYEESNTALFLAMASSKLSEETVEEIENIDGIKDSIPYVMDFGYIDQDRNFGQPDLFITGVDPEDEPLFVTENAVLEDGDRLEAGDGFTATIGHDLADVLDLEVGDTVELKEENFVVKGVYKKFGDDGLDSGAIIPIDVAFELLDTEEYSGVVIYPEDIDDVEDLAENIEESVEDVTALSTEEFATQISSVLDQIQIFTFGVAGISAVVGGLGVMNTMIMSVMERKREIGVLKAVGATNGYVLRLILIESSLLSLIGGLIGLLIGWLASLGLTLATNGALTGYVSFGLATRSLAFAIVLGVIGGYYPSKKASELSPVEALRYE